MEKTLVFQHLAFKFWFIRHALSFRLPLFLSVSYDCLLLSVLWYLALTVPENSNQLLILFDMYVVKDVHELFKGLRIHSLYIICYLADRRKLFKI